LWREDPRHVGGRNALRLLGDWWGASAMSKQSEADIDRSLHYGLKAIEISKERQIPVTPRNYELLFNYVTGENQALVQSVDHLLDRDGRLSDTEARRIHDEFLSPSGQADAVEEIGSQLSSEIKQAMAVIAAAAGTTGAYGESLEGVANRIADTQTGADLKMVIKTLAQASREMQRNSVELEDKLADSEQQINALNERLEELRTESRTDSLTGIANRMCFDETLEAEIANVDETQEELCLCLGDVDRFKQFNDTYGHQTGDRVLRLVASAIAGHVKGRDLAARFGGEEFAIILPQTNLRAAVTVADQIRERVHAKELIKKSTGESLGSITMSFGVARYRHGEPIEDLVARADACLYAAKNAGRNRVKCEADPDVNGSMVA